MESLCIKVSSFRLGQKKNVDKRKKKSGEFGKMAQRRNKKKSFNHHVCRYCNRPVKEDEIATSLYAKEEGNSKIKFKYVEKLDDTSELLNYFNTLDLEEQKEDRRKKNGKGKEILNEGTQEVNDIQEMVVFIDLLKVINISLLDEESIRRKFNNMVRWFLKYVIKQKLIWPPKIGDEVVDLYDLYMEVQLNGGRTKVTQEKFWPYISIDLGLKLIQPYKLMMLYNEYLDIMDWYYNNIKKRKEEVGIVLFEEGGSSSMQDSKKIFESARMDRKIAIRMKKQE
ncbi:hypothetical protein E3N88_38265 [Mikania micrantha]|uniref:ARID domain-containing protein n=1 Tax=Mikania micrantha TaxID=192012 RepID=A0A5N6LTI5_9ASTR|nr:hypothetical protein E3N88_38265 [Mikania micrantha]